VVSSIDPVTVSLPSPLPFRVPPFHGVAIYIGMPAAGRGRVLTRGLTISYTAHDERPSRAMNRKLKNLNVCMANY